MGSLSLAPALASSVDNCGMTSQGFHACDAGSTQTALNDSFVSGLPRHFVPRNDDGVQGDSSLATGLATGTTLNDGTLQGFFTRHYEERIFGRVPCHEVTQPVRLSKTTLLRNPE